MVPGGRLDEHDGDTDPSISTILDCAVKCWQADHSLATDHVVCIMRELRKLLGKLHPGLVAIYNTKSSPIRALEVLRVSGAKCYYGNLNMMVQYETNNQLLKGSSRLCSGTVALMELNAILGFVITFLQTLHEREVTSRSFPAKQKINIFLKEVAYEHSALSRLNCRLSLIRCPGRHALVSQLSECLSDNETVVMRLAQILEKLRPIHTSVVEILATTGLQLAHS